MYLRTKKAVRQRLQKRAKKNNHISKWNRNRRSLSLAAPVLYNKGRRIQKVDYKIIKADNKGNVLSRGVSIEINCRVRESWSAF